MMPTAKTTTKKATTKQAELTPATILTSSQMPVPNEKVPHLILKSDSYWKIIDTWKVNNQVEAKSKITREEDYT